MSRPVVPFLARQPELAGLWARQRGAEGLDTAWKRLPITGRFFLVAFRPSWRPFALWLLREVSLEGWDMEDVKHFLALFSESQTNQQEKEVVK